MTAIVILLVVILLCMFKTVRIFIGVLFLLVWWNWPQTDKTVAHESPAAIEQATEPEPVPLPRARPRPTVQQ
jgi:hypothetical protein